MDIVGLDKDGEGQGFNVSDFIFQNRVLLAITLIALILLGIGFYFATKTPASDIEIVTDTTTEEVVEKVIAEVAGAVEKPGVYKLPSSSRVEDLLIAAGGISADADRTWMDKSLNRAAKIIDGQKLYIMAIGEQTATASANNSTPYQNDSSVFGATNSTLVNINAASLAELDNLPGIGPVYGQKIIDHRPYSDREELVSKSVIPQSTYEKLKDQIAVY